MKKYLQFSLFYFLLSSGDANAQTKSVITSPNGGEVWTAGSIRNITWNSCLMCSFANVQLQYSTDNGSTWTNIVTTLDSDKSYAWTVPNTPSTACRVKIINNTGSPIDLSDNVFTITGSVGMHNETSLTHQLNIYPNPFLIQAIFSLSKEIQNGSLLIYDLSGKEIKNLNFSGNQVIIERESLPGGMYFYQIISENITITSGKLIIQ